MEVHQHAEAESSLSGGLEADLHIGQARPTWRSEAGGERTGRRWEAGVLMWGECGQ